MCCRRRQPLPKRNNAKNALPPSCINNKFNARRAAAIPSCSNKFRLFVRRTVVRMPSVVRVSGTKKKKKHEHKLIQYPGYQAKLLYKVKTHVDILHLN